MRESTLASQCRPVAPGRSELSCDEDARIVYTWNGLFVGGLLVGGVALASGLAWMWLDRRQRRPHGPRAWIAPHADGVVLGVGGAL